MHTTQPEEAKADELWRWNTPPTVK